MKKETRFMALQIGDVFKFASENDPRFLTSGMARGNWIKTSARKYTHANTGGDYTVGSTAVAVVLIRRNEKLLPHEIRDAEQMDAYERDRARAAEVFRKNPDIHVDINSHNQREAEGYIKNPGAKHKKKKYIITVYKPGKGWKQTNIFKHKEAAIEYAHVLKNSYSKVRVSEIN